MTGDFEYDVFVSHASEDKEGVARPLAHDLARAGLRVWYDESALSLGDNLRRSIDNGLARSRFGIVVLSPRFFTKHWPQRELDGLTALETSDGRARILPVWHGVSQTDVAQYSPPLANVVAANTADGLRSVVSQVIAVVVAGDQPVNAAYEFVHRGEDVDLVALVRQSGGTIEGHVFKDCRLHGPAILGLQGDISFVNLTFEAPQLWAIDEGRPYVGAIPIMRSRIESCEFDQVGLAAPAAVLDRIVYLPPATGRGTGGPSP